MRIVKIAGLVIAGIIAVMLVGVALVALFFDPNHYKQQIQQLVTDKTGRELTLNGDLKLSVFPWLAVQVGPATLGNAKGFGDTPMVSVAGAKLGVKLWPLLSGRFEIGAVELDAPQVLLIKASDTSNNWSDLGEHDEQVDTPSNEKSSSELNAVVASISIRKGLVRYEDRMAHTQTTLSEFDFNTGKLESGRPFALKSTFKVQRGDSLQIDAKLNADVTANMAASQYELRKPDIVLLLKGEGYPSEGQPITLKADQIVQNTAAQTTQIQSLNLATVLKGGRYPKDGMPVDMQVATISANLAAQTAELTAINLNAGGAKISAQLQVTHISDAPSVTGTFKLAPISLRDVAGKLRIDLPKTSDPKTLQRFSMEGGLVGNKTSAELRPLTLRLDDTTMTGSAGIADFASSALRFDLALDAINLDRYLPPPDPQAEKQASQPAAEAKPTPIPTDFIHGLNMRGKLAIGALTLRKMPIAKLLIGIDAGDDKLQLNPLQASLYEGRYHGNIAIDASNKQPRFNIEQHVEGINFAPLFAALYNTKRIAGRGNANMKLTALGNDTGALKRSLNGTLDFSAVDGAIQGFDLWYEIRRARALLKQQAIPARSGPEQTAFTSLKGSAQVDNGQINNKDLLAALQYLKVTGQGSVNLATDVVDYRLTAAVNKIPAEDKLASETQDLSSLSIPVKVTGTLAAPKVRPDLEGLVKEKAKQRIEEEKEKAIDKAKEKLQDKLRGLFGG